MIKQVGEKSNVVRRDTQLERTILQRLNGPAKERVPGTRKAATEKGGTGEKASTVDSIGRIKVGDRLYIRVPDALPNNPIQGGYRVEPSGKVPLGPSYGRVAVSGLTPEEAEAKIRDHLARLLRDRDPQVSVTWYDPVVHGTRQGTGKETEKVKE